MSSKSGNSNSSSECDALASFFAVGMLFLAGYGAYKFFTSHSDEQSERWRSLTKKERQLLSELTKEGLL